MALYKSVSGRSEVRGVESLPEGGEERNDDGDRGGGGDVEDDTERSEDELGRFVCLFLWLI